MDELVREIRQDVKEIKSGMVELIKQGAIHNMILKEHERRSTNLESRILPIEDEKKFRSKAFTAILGLGGLMGVLISTLKLVEMIKRLS